MNKYVKMIGFAAVIGIVALAALAGAAVAFAQTATPNAPAGTCPGAAGGYGYGMMGSGAGMMSRGYGFMAEYRDVIHARVAEALGLSFDDFNAALAEGKTLCVIAQEKGVDFATVQAAMQAGMAEALKQAVADGKITQEQANWMLRHHAQRQAWHAQGGGPMTGRRDRGMMGGWGSPRPFVTPIP